MRVSLVGLFLLKAIAAFVIGLFIWYQIGTLVTIPVALLSKAAVASLFPVWAEGVEQSGVALTLLTSLQVTSAAAAPGQIALLSPEVEFLKYGYGLPLLVALLLASDAQHKWRKMIIGALVLLPFQVWGVSFDWLKQVALEAGAGGFSPLAREVIAFAYQFGYLVLPALLPVLLWAIMDRRFLTTFVVEATLAGEREVTPNTPPER
jgi:hypothetical protein